MARITNYFPENTGMPNPLVVTVERRVRFEEIDLLGMVWHGRYASYFEDGRIAFGDRYGLTYQTFISHQTMAPVVQMHFDYKSPLRFDETFRITTRLHWSEAARLNFSYVLEKNDTTMVATGYTVQLLTEPDGTVLLLVPGWMRDFREKWLSGQWEV